jgi:hypothetical protein
MTAVLGGLILALLILGGFQLFARWLSVRDARRERLLEESWAVYRASRTIHDQTVEALQAMLDAARSQRDRP